MKRSMIVIAGWVLCALAAAAWAAPAAENAAMPLALRVAGNQILNSKNQPVRLTGVNCASMEWSANGQGHILQSVKVAIDDWKANCIRLPLAQDRWFGKTNEQKDDGKAYRALVKEVVDLCASKGVYIILDLHWSDCGEWGVNIAQHPMPDANSVVFWKDIAPVYANHPAVIYDLYNEPHSVTWDIWLSGGTVTDRTPSRGAQPRTYEAPGMQAMLDTVRGTGAKNVVVVGGLDWAYDLSGILAGRQLKDPNGNGVIYANHCYNNKNQPVATWIANMEKASAVFPIIISEFGGQYYVPGTEPPPRPAATRAAATRPTTRGARAGRGGPPPPPANGPDWLLRMMQAIEDHHWSYTAWDFHPQASPILISNWNYTPTPFFGVYAKRMLDGTWQRYVPPPTTAATTRPG